MYNRIDCNPCLKSSVCSFLPGRESSLAVLFFCLVIFPVIQTVYSDAFTVTADNASGSETPEGEFIIDLSGNVIVTDGDVYVYSNAGRVWQKTGSAVFTGEVRVEMDSILATGDRLSYDRNSGIIILSGHAELTDENNVLHADEVTYYRNTGKALARGNVLVTGEWLGIVTGEYAFYDMERGSFFVTQEAHLVRYDESDSLIVIADRLEFFPDSTKAEAQGNVIIEVPLQNFTATSEYARYFGDQNRLELLGSPVLNSPDGELSGDWQEILFENQELIQVRVEGNAKGYFIESGIDPPGESWMSSQHALFMFSEGVIDSVSIEGSVEVIVKSGGEAAARAEVNTVRGEKLEMKFMNGVIDMVTVVGHVSGTYSYFEE